MTKKFSSILMLVLCLLSFSSCDTSTSPTSSSGNQVLSTEEISDYMISLSEVWRYGRELHPWWDIHDINKWDAAYYQCVETMSSDPTMTYFAYYEMLLEFTSMLEDGHVRFGINANIKQSIGSLPLDFEYIDGKYYVIGSQIDSLCELIKINDVNTEDYLNENVASKISISTPNARQNQMVKYLATGEMGTKIQFTVLSSDETEKTIELTYVKQSPSQDTSLQSLLQYDYTPIYTSDTYTFGSVDENTYYLGVYTLESSGMIEEFDENIFPHLEDNKKVIIDIRNNDGGNSDNGLEILRYFSSGTIHPTKTMAQLNNGYFLCFGLQIEENPQLEEMLEDEEFLEGLDQNAEVFLEQVSTAEEMLAGKYYEVTQDEDVVLESKRVGMQVTLLTSYTTYSATDTMADAARQLDNVTLVGTNTGGSTGNTAGCPLKNGMTFYLTAQRCVNSEGVEITGNGIDPDIWVWQDIGDLRNGKDTVYEYAVLN